MYNVQYYRRPAVFITLINAHMHVFNPPITHMCFTARTRRMRTRHLSTAIFHQNPVLSHCHVSRTKHSVESPSWIHVPFCLKSYVYGRTFSIIFPVFGSCMAMQGSEKHVEPPNSESCWLLVAFITSGRTRSCMQFHQKGKK